MTLSDFITKLFNLETTQKYCDTFGRDVEMLLKGGKPQLKKVFENGKLLFKKRYANGEVVESTEYLIKDGKDRGFIHKEKIGDRLRIIKNLCRADSKRDLEKTEFWDAKTGRLISEAETVFKTRGRSLYTARFFEGGQLVKTEERLSQKNELLNEVTDVVNCDYRNGKLLAAHTFHLINDKQIAYSVRFFEKGKLAFADSNEGFFRDAGGRLLNAQTLVEYGEKYNINLTGAILRHQEGVRKLETQKKEEQKRVQAKRAQIKQAQAKRAKEIANQNRIQKAKIKTRNNATRTIISQMTKVIPDRNTVAGIICEARKEMRIK